ncbi:MAG: HYR domain-containing protein [Blastocatellia bacterium]
MKSNNKLAQYSVVAVVVVAGLLIWLAFPAGRAPKANPGFSKGDVFCGVGNGKVKRFSPTGTLLQTLDSGLSGFTTGMAFDCAGNLISTQFNSKAVVKFDLEGNLLGNFGSGYDGSPESVVLDGSENVYIGQVDDSKLIRKFGGAGNFLTTFAPPTEARGTDWLDLAADQKTLFYTSEGKNIKRFDVSTNTALSNFNAAPLPGTFAYALRILRNGEVLVANTQSIHRLNASGNIVQTYDAPGEDNWFALNLDPDGKTFWSGNLTSGKVHRFDIGTGAVVTSWDSSPFSQLGGIAVFGEITIATGSDLVVTKTDTPDPVITCSDLTYTITVTNKGPCPASRVELKDTVPANTTLRTFTPPGGWSCSIPAAGGTGTVNCMKTSALNDGETATFTFVVRVNPTTPDGTILSNTVSVSSVTPDPDPDNNQATATTTVGPNPPPVITCPANITKPTDPGLCSAVVTYSATATDNCPGVTVGCAPPSGSVFPKGTTPVTCTATDVGGKSSSCSFTVTVVDQEKPRITCPKDITTTSCGSAVVVTYPPPVVSDNCPGVTFACVPPSSSPFPLGVTTVTCTATDTSGNQSSCGFKVNIEAVKCKTICFRSPQYYLLNLNSLPPGTVLIGGVNSNAEVNTTDLDNIKLALQGNALGLGTLTPLQQLNQEFVAAQLSLEAAGGDGSPPAIDALWSPLHAYGLNLGPIPLSNGFTFTRDSMLKDLFMQARSAIFENRTADMVLIANLLDLLNGNSPLNACGPQHPIADLVPIVPNGFSSFCAFFTSSGMQFLRITIKNQGDAAAPASTTAVAFGNVAVSVATPALLPNETVDLNVAVPTGGGPPVLIKITADVGGTLAERSNSNNVVTVSCP